MNFISLPLDSVSQAIALRLQELLVSNNVAWFVSGGSNIGIQVAAMQLLFQSGADLSKLTVLLNDERYGVVDHPDSNWYQLKQAGFMVNGPKFVEPFTSQETTLGQAVDRYEQIISTVLNDNYSYSQLGMGDDGHTSGILPNSIATSSDTLVCGYIHEPYQRLTTTFETIRQFNEAVLVVYGESKWPGLKQLQTRQDPVAQPVQIVADIPRATIYTDYKITVAF